jgi:hypothetical protein
MSFLAETFAIVLGVLIADGVKGALKYFWPKIDFAVRRKFRRTVIE